MMAKLGIFILALVSLTSCLMPGEEHLSVESANAQFASMQASLDQNAKMDAETRAQLQKLEATSRQFATDLKARDEEAAKRSFDQMMLAMLEVKMNRKVTTPHLYATAGVGVTSGLAGLEKARYPEVERNFSAILAASNHRATAEQLKREVPRSPKAPLGN